jgi:predicted glycosyltransferase
LPDLIEDSLRPQPLRNKSLKIWIDLDNTPHVPFFIPIISALEARGYQVVLTARDAFQVRELADRSGLRYERIGRHYGKNPMMKIIGLVWRAGRLVPFVLRHRPAVALSHGARSQILLGNLVRMPTVLIADYEHARHIPFGGPRWMIVPESLRGHRFPIRPGQVKYYRGIKEDVYVPSFKPDPALLDELGAGRDKLLVTVRPPANEAHYYNPESDDLLKEFMARLTQTSGVCAILLPRNHKQERVLQRDHPDWFANRRTIVPSVAVDGLSLLWFSDLVVSGGGTMNREAAALGIPVYSIFRGTSGAVDRALEKDGRLTMIRTTDEIWTKIALTKRDKELAFENRPRLALEDIINDLEEIIRSERTSCRNRP